MAFTIKDFAGKRIAPIVAGLALVATSLPAAAACEAGAADPAASIDVIQTSTTAIWDQKDADAIDRYISADYVEHTADPSMPPGIEGFRMVHAAFTGGFPDLTIEFDEQLASGDYVASRVVLRGTNTGSFMGMEPTGQAVEVRGIRLDRVCDGQIVEHWAVVDVPGMMAQLQGN
ncbi:MAG: ester cyclase [Pseudomonadota bacterium]